MFTRTLTLIIGLILFAVCTSIADIPRLITYQGRLSDDLGDPIADGKYDVDFTIYDDSTSGTGLWTETQTVDVEDGLFNVHLGFAKAMPKSIFAGFPDLFLAMVVDGGPEMAPRIRLTSSAFAYHALSVADSSVELGDLAQSGASDGDGIRWKAGVGWITDTYGGGDINGVTAGNGLIGGGTIGTVTLAVGEGTGIDISVDEVALDVTYTDERYVNSTGDGMTGPLVFDYGSDALMDAMIDPENRAIKIYDGGLLLGQLQRGSTNPYGRLDLYSHTPDHQGQKAAIYGSWWGELELYDDDGDPTVELVANQNSGGHLRLQQQDGTFGISLYGGDTTDGSRMYMYNAAGAMKAKIDADATGNDAAVMPNSSISAAEMFNEPGIAVTVDDTLEYVVPSSLTEIDTITITIPASGYIIVETRCYCRIAEIDGFIYCYLQIDEPAGGGLQKPHYTCSATSAGTIYNPVYLSRVYYKTAGTHSFVLKGVSEFYSTGGSGMSSIYNVVMTAKYFPTAYGDVITMVSSADASNFSNAVAVAPTRLSDESDRTDEGGYRVDLRELELKAAKAHAAAEQAERELLEAQVRELEDSQKQNE